MRKIAFYVSLTALLMISGCKENENGGLSSMELQYTFQSGSEGWISGYADYPDEQGAESYYEFRFSTAGLPAPLDTSDRVLLQSGCNHSDDLFMFIKRKITGLLPDHQFYVSIEAEIATCIRNNMIGVGGSPGGSVYVKAGAFYREPQKELNDSENWFRMNMDKGNQSQDGVNMKVIGNLENGLDQDVWVLKTISTSSPVQVTSDKDGTLWLILGTDSGYEGTSSVYYNSISARIE